MDRPRAIGHVARIYGLTARTLRHYEEEGLITSSRDATNRRTYDQQACSRLERIIPLRNAGVSLSDISVFLKLGDNVDDPEMHVAYALKKLRERLETVQQESAAIQLAIGALENNRQGRRSSNPPMRAARTGLGS
jgi:DNA-binding transcriptional MerR regulator